MRPSSSAVGSRPRWPTLPRRAVRADRPGLELSGAQRVPVRQRRGRQPTAGLGVGAGRPTTGREGVEHGREVPGIGCDGAGQISGQSVAVHGGRDGGVGEPDPAGRGDEHVARMHPAVQRASLVRCGKGVGRVCQVIAIPGLPCFLWSRPFTPTQRCQMAWRIDCWRGKVGSPYATALPVALPSSARYPHVGWFSSFGGSGRRCRWRGPLGRPRCSVVRGAQVRRCPGCLAKLRGGGCFWRQSRTG